MSTMFFIAGPPRTGTSFLAGLLAQHGVWSGETIQADEDNKKGYYENRQIVDILKQMIKRNGRRARMDATPIHEFQYRPDVRSAILEVVDGQDQWLFKDGKLLLVWPLFMEAFPEAIWILTKRSKKAIVASLRRTRTWSRRIRKAGYSDRNLHRMVDTLRAQQRQVADAVKRSCWIDTDALIQSEEAAKDFIEYCGLEFTPQVYHRWVDPEIWHGE